MANRENKRFVHLHLHDEYSALDGFGSPETYAKRAKAMGFRYLAVTNHGNVDSAIKFQKACAAEGIVPIIGCELYIDRDRHNRDASAGRCHINVWVKDETGWNNLLRMLTIANLEGFLKRPRIDPTTLLKHLDGLIVGTACLGSFVNTDWGMELFKTLADRIGDDLYIEIMPHAWPGQAEFNLKMLKLARSHCVKIIATNDCHYPERKDAGTQELQLAIATSADWDDPKRYRFAVDTLYLCSANKMRQYFGGHHEEIPEETIEIALATTLEVARKCSGFTAKQCDVHLPLIPGVAEGEEDAYFIRLVRKGLRQKIASGAIPEDRRNLYDERIVEELDLLVSKGFSRYFLIVWEIMSWCRENNIMTGPGRGSVGGCLVAYLIGITQVDTIEYGLVFSRFISPERSDLPDIDLDFEQGRRGEVIDHIKQLYGRNNVSQISTFLTMQGKGALQDVARTMKVPRDEVAAVTKLLDDKEELTVEMFRDSEFAELVLFWVQHPELVEKAVAIQGTVRGYGKHAAGVCISSVDLTLGTKCNLVKRNGSVLANWDKDDAEHMGMMKLDVLGLIALDRIHECLDLIKAEHGEAINLATLSLDDLDVLADLSDGKTTGVFQLGSPGLTRFCQELAIDSFKDIYNATALFRPGTLRSGMAKEFVARKHGKAWKAIHERVRELTQDTYGVILYQEQVMLMAKTLAGFDWAKCNKMRKVIGKSKGAAEFNKFREDFVNGCVSGETLNASQAERLFDDIVSFSSYGFNRCLTPDTMVETASGFKSIEEVSVGEKVMSPSGPTLVVAKHDNGPKDVYEVELESGKKIKCTLDHKFLASNGKTLPLWRIIKGGLDIMCEDL